MTFRVGCCNCLAAMTDKLQERSPLQYSLLRNLSCLSPPNLATKPEICQSNFKKLLQVLLSKKQFSADHCDVANRQFTSFCEDIVKNKVDDFLAFKETKQKVSTRSTQSILQKLTKNEKL